MDERFDEGQETKGNQGNGEWNESQMNQNESRMNQNGGQMGQNESRMNQNGGQMSQNESRMNQNGGQMGQNESRMNQNGGQMGQNESRMNQNGGQMSQNDNQRVNVVQGGMENLGYENGFHMEQMESPKNRKERRRQEKLQKQALKKERKEKRRHSFVAKAGRMVAYGILFGGAFGVAFQGIQMGSNYLLTGSFYPAEASSSKKTTKEIQNVELLTTTKETDSSVAAVVSNVMPSIVSVTSTFEEVGYDFFFNQYSRESTGYGSGIIIGKSEDTLLVVTNYHVVQGAKEVAVGFIDSEYVTATVKGYDSDADLAVLSIDLEEMEQSTIDSIKVAVLGESEELLVGEQAIAIGNAMGYGQSVTVGYVSALNREVQLTDKTMTLLQTDAAINPGNSGGALLNSKGEVIGINTVKYSDTSVEGMGYAIPITTATPIINDLMNQEVIEEKDKAFLGVGGDSVTQEYNERFGMPIGAYVSKVSDNSPAEKAGISAGDIITKIGDYDIESWDDLQNAIEQYKGGESAVVVLQRSDSRGKYKEQELEVTFGYRSENQ